MDQISALCCEVLETILGEASFTFQTSLLDCHGSSARRNQIFLETNVSFTEITFQKDDFMQRFESKDILNSKWSPYSLIWASFYLSHSVEPNFSATHAVCVIVPFVRLDSNGNLRPRIQTRWHGHGMGVHRRVGSSKPAFNTTECQFASLVTRPSHLFFSQRHLGRAPNPPRDVLTIVA